MGQIIVWEWDDPELMAEHFLTVASYNLQHPAQFTDDALALLEQVFKEHLDEGLALKEVRRRVNAASKQSILKPAPERRPFLKRWARTIDSVYIPGQAQGAAARVRAWAVSVKSEL